MSRMKRILVLGGDGMLGHKVFQVLSRQHETFATFLDPAGNTPLLPVYDSIESSRLVFGVNALNFNTVVRAFVRVKPDVVVNCIGIIKQLKEAKDPVATISLNSLFPHTLADLCAASGTRLFHISTDCVFSGRKGGYTEEDIPDAEDLYGRSKLLGEINRTGCLTLRTSILGRDFLKNDALLEWFLQQCGKKIKGYKKAIFSGFPTQEFARILGYLIEEHPNLSGLYHVASAPISKYDLLVKIRDAMHLPIEIEPDMDFVCDRSLDATRFFSTTSFPMPSWDEMVCSFATDTTPYDSWKEKTTQMRQEH